MTNTIRKSRKNFTPAQKLEYADVSGLINDFGYKSKTKLKDGIGEFVKWYREFYGKL